MSLSPDAYSHQADKTRRRSVDVGCLALALSTNDKSPGGMDDTGLVTPPEYAELVIRMRDDARAAVGYGDPGPIPPIDDETREQLVRAADSWDFEPQKFDKESLTWIAFLLFSALFCVQGVEEAVGIPIERIGELLYGMPMVYRRENKYHNFEHAVDVLQATHHLLWKAGMVPPVAILLEGTREWTPPVETVDPMTSCLGPLDLFCLYIASIGHDAGHPGFTNMFMQNGKSPLYKLYNGQSSLENMHYTLLIAVLQKQGLISMLDNLNDPYSFRKLLFATILATDMRVHKDFMMKFERFLDGGVTDAWTKRVLVCQAIIKWADISNPCRPFSVSETWAEALGQEWTSQLELEHRLNMPQTMRYAADELAKARSQVCFIEAFAQPLSELTARGIPSASFFVEQCCDNLTKWQERLLSHSAGPSSNAEMENASTASMEITEDYLSAFPMTLPPSFNDRQAQSEGMLIASRRTHSSSSSSSSILSSRSVSPSPVSSTAPVPLPALSFISSGTASGSSDNSSSPVLSPSDSSSTKPSRAMSHMSDSSTLSAADIRGSDNASIRAAYNATIRKKVSVMSNRNSWSPDPRNSVRLVSDLSLGVALSTATSPAS